MTAEKRKKWEAANRAFARAPKTAEGKLPAAYIKRVRAKLIQVGYVLPHGILPMLATYAPEEVALAHEYALAIADPKPRTTRMPSKPKWLESYRVSPEREYLDPKRAEKSTHKIVTEASFYARNPEERVVPAE